MPAISTPTTPHIPNGHRNIAIPLLRLRSTWHQNAEADVATAVKNTAGALQDKTATDGSGDLSKTDWMDYYNCRKQGTNSFECAAFQPENSTDGVSQGYPRFGSNESAAGYLGYVRLTGASSGTASVRNDWAL